MNPAIASREDFDAYERDRLIAQHCNFFRTSDAASVIAPRGHTIADEVEQEQLTAYPKPINEAALEVRIRGLRIDLFDWKTFDLPLIKPCRVEDSPSENESWRADPIGMATRGDIATPLVYYDFGVIDELVELLARERRYWRPEALWAAERGWSWRRWVDHLAALVGEEYDALWTAEIEQFEKVG